VKRDADIAKQHEGKATLPSRSARTARDDTSPHPLLDLQHHAGNHAVQDLLHSGVVRAKLAVSQPNDPEEREADQVAEKVMRSPAPCSCAAGGEMCDKCQANSQSTVHRQASALAQTPGVINDVLRSPGHPLDSATRDFFEPRFGRDFSHVCIHTSPEAASSARAINAHAYALGPHIAFAPGQYSPGTTSGRALLAHELTHTLQPTREPKLAREPDNTAPAPPTNTPLVDCSAFFASQQIAAFGGKAGNWNLNAIVNAIVPALTNCELAYVMIDVVPKSTGDDPRQEALDRATTVRQALIQWIGPGKFTEDRFQTGFSSGNDDGSEVTIYIQSRGKVISKGTAGPPSVPSPPTIKPIQGWQTVLSAGGQIAWHVDLASGKPAGTPQDVTLQFQAARNFVGHPENESGSELQGILQVGYNLTTQQVTVLSGAQFTEVLSLFNGLLQISGFAQLLTGVAAGKGSIAGQIQPSVGAQATVQVGKTQIGVMVFRGLTMVPGGESTQDTGAGLGAQFSF
jgi:hypothetical protein